MKVYEIVEPLDEINLKHATAAGIMSASMMGLNHKAMTPGIPNIPRPSVPAPQETKKQIDPKMQAAIETIAQRYDADPELIEQVFELAKKYEKPGFPTAKDILAIIAVESEFDPDAVSKLKKDPAIGLMQVRPREWGLNPEDLKDPETSIRVGSDILHKYFRHLRGDKAGAIQAYNIGLDNFKQGQEAPDYLNKVLVRLKHIPSIT